MNVSAWSIRNPIPSVLLFVMLTLLGLMGFRAMKIQNFPDIDLPTVTVTAALPGASPAQLETEVARKIENSIATLQGVKHIYTTVQDGVATVTALRAHLRARGGAWAAALDESRRVRVAVNQDMAANETPVRNGDEVAFFPPVTGG